MDEQLRILELIEAGAISVEEGVRRLEALAGAADPPEPAPAPAPSVDRPVWVRWVWQAVFWTGVALLAAGGLLVSGVYAWDIADGWLIWGWLLLTLGLVGVLLGWWLQQAHWLFVRVRQPDGPNVFVALPLPLGPLAWLLRVVGPFIPQLEGTAIDEIILAMREEARRGRPLMVQVNEGEGREQVQVYLG
jgi:hypothetical protein